MKKILYLIGVIPLLLSCSMLNDKVGLSDDNVIEEVAEAIISDKLGVDIDLTPQTDEM